MSKSAALSHRPQNWKRGTCGNPEKIPRGPSRFTKERLKREQENGGLQPLDYQLQIVRDESQPTEIRLQAARDAAPYLHARLSAVVVQELEPEALVHLTPTPDLVAQIRGRLGRDANAPTAPALSAPAAAEPGPDAERQASADAAMTLESARMAAKLNPAPRRALAGGNLALYRERDLLSDPRAGDFEPDAV